MGKDRLMPLKIKLASYHTRDRLISLTEWYNLQDMVVVYDSLQLAHKCILNSFYGYVMRK